MDQRSGTTSTQIIVHLPHGQDVTPVIENIKQSVSLFGGTAEASTQVDGAATQDDGRSAFRDVDIESLHKRFLAFSKKTKSITRITDSFLLGFCFIATVSSFVFLTANQAFVVSILICFAGLVVSALYDTFIRNETYDEFFSSLSLVNLKALLQSSLLEDSEKKLVRAYMNDNHHGRSTKDSQ